MKNFSVRQLVTAAVIAALYAALTIPLGAIASQSLFQIRPAEALTVLPILFIEAVPGVAIGCLIANIFGGGVYDIVFGSLITLAAAILTRRIKNKYIALMPPVLLNALLLPIIWYFAAGEGAYFYSFVSVLITQAIWIYGLGLPLLKVLKRSNAAVFLNNIPVKTTGQKAEGVKTKPPEVSVEDAPAD